MLVGRGSPASALSVCSMAHPGSRVSRKGGRCQFVRASVDSCAPVSIRPFVASGRLRTGEEGGYCPVALGLAIRIHTRRQFFS
jgi:hypothetical protein